MARNDVLRRYLDAGLEFTQMTQSRAEELVKDLVKAGELQADQAREAVTEMLERSRKTSERLLETVRAEVREQITSLGLASQSDLDRLEDRIAELVGSATSSLRAMADRAPAKKTAKKTAKKASTTKAAAKKAVARKAPAKKSAAKKSAAKKAPAKKSTKRA